MLLSFVFDIPIFLPILGVFLIWMSQKEALGRKIGWILVFGVAAIVILACLLLKQFFLLGLLLVSLLITGILQKTFHRFMLTFGFFTLTIFWLVSGGLYYDLWGAGGNHFMWYSWLDKMGVITTFPVPVPTYENFWGFWNLFAFFLFLTYPVILFWMGPLFYKILCWLKGIFFGHIPGQTGLWGLITNK